MRKIEELLTLLSDFRKTDQRGSKSLDLGHFFPITHGNLLSYNIFFRLIENHFKEVEELKLPETFTDLTLPKRNGLDVKIKNGPITVHFTTDQP